MDLALKSMQMEGVLAESFPGKTLQDFLAQERSEVERSEVQRQEIPCRYDHGRHWQSQGRQEMRGSWW